MFLIVSTCIYPAWANDSSKSIVQTVPGTASNTSNRITNNEISNNAGNNTTTANYVTGDNHQSDASKPDALHTNNLTPNNNGKTNKTTLPKKAFSIATAFLIGTPVCIVRRTKYEERYTINNWVGEGAPKYEKVLAGIVWFPFAAICGTGEAPFDALANGLMYPAFSKDQLSAGKLIQNN